MKYVVTETAPVRVAGRRVKAGEPIELTDLAASYERAAGHVAPFEEPSKPSETPSKSSKAKA